ncbi:angiopoietin-related protein 7-like [Arapaima gigas]
MVLIVLLQVCRVLALCIMCFLVKGNYTDLQQVTHRISGGPIDCGEYSNLVMPNGLCRLEAILPQLEEHQCPEMLRCTDQVSFWMHENEESKQQILFLKETVSELQEELRNHRHRVKVLELQNEEKNRFNSSLERRMQELKRRHVDAGTLLHLQGSLIFIMQAQLRNLSILVENTRRSPGCMVNIVHSSPLLSAQEVLYPEVPHVRNCPVDCASIYYNGVRRSGVYTVVPSMGAMPVEVFCDMDTAGGGWTVIQRRQDGSERFDRMWQEYKEGFGDLYTEFWLGNEHIHQLSSQAQYSLRIELEDWSSKHKHALYDSFSIEGETNRYRLHVTGFSGTVEDSFSWYHDKKSFSTPDTGNICAEISHGGWWYHQCFFANLNGIYYTGGQYSPRGKRPLGPDGIVWYAWKDSDYYSLRKVSMMIRPHTFRPRLSP